MASKPTPSSSANRLEPLKDLQVFLTQTIRLLRRKPSLSNKMGFVAQTSYQFHEILTMISTDEKSEVLKAPFLNRLYCLLLEMSLGLSQQQYDFGDTFSIDIKNHLFVMQTKFSGVSYLSDLLITEVRRKFEKLFSVMGFLSEKGTSKQAGLLFNICDRPEDLTSLLRCSLIMLQFPDFDQSVALERCQILVKLLGKLCSPDLMLHVSYNKRENGKRIASFNRSVSCEHKYAPNGPIISLSVELNASMSFAEQAILPVPHLCSLLEVFADELLMHEQLRELLTVADFVSCSGEKIFPYHHGDSDIAIVLEVISAHFLLSVSDELSIHHFHNTLFWSHANCHKIPDLTLGSAIILLGTCVMLSPPEVLQAHLISLVSSCIGINRAPCARELSSVLLNCYVSAFEQSIILYTMHMGINDGSGSGYTIPCMMGIGSHSSFQSHIRPVTYEKINLQICKLVDSCRGFDGIFSRTKSDLMSSSMAYIKENQYILDETCRDETCLILNCIISNILCEEIGVNLLYKNREVSRQEMYHLASVLKLMSCSLLQVVWYMRQSGSLDGLKTLSDYSLCRTYNSLTGIISCFGQFSVKNQLIQKIFCDEMGKYPARHKETKLMLVHFTDLLLSSFYTGPEFVWKSCIFLMMVLMNLVIFEDNLDSLKALLGLNQSDFSRSSQAINLQGIVRNSSLILASNFHNTQMLFLRENSQYLTDDTKRTDTLAINLNDSQDGKAESSQEIICHAKRDDDNICKGESFTKCIKNGNDLADFIQCKSGKDYSSWLKKRARFRKWRCEKMALTERERKRRRWRHIKGDITEHTVC